MWFEVAVRVGCKSEPDRRMVARRTSKESCALNHRILKGNCYFLKCHAFSLNVSSPTAPSLSPVFLASSDMRMAYTAGSRTLHNLVRDFFAGTRPLGEGHLQNRRHTSCQLAMVAWKICIPAHAEAILPSSRAVLTPTRNVRTYIVPCIVPPQYKMPNISTTSRADQTTAPKRSRTLEDHGDPNLDAGCRGCRWRACGRKLPC